MLFLFCQTMQSATIALILLTISFVHHVQCSGVIVSKLRAPKHHLIHPQRIMRHQATPTVTTPTDQDIAYCESIEREVFCSSGLAQNAVDFLLSCGETADSNFELSSIISMCSKSESGASCTSLSRSITEQNFEENCGSDIFNVNSCPPKCRSRLEDLKSSLGCCINSYLNRPFSSSRYFNNYVWNLCGVPLPPMDCEDGLTLNTPVTLRNCTNNFNIFVDFQLHSYCSNTGQTYVNSLLEDSRCSQINFNTAKSIVDTCSIKADGEFCSIPEDEFNSKYVSLLESNCDLEISNANVVCRSICRDTLVETKATLDCCINLFNQSNSGIYDMSDHEDVPTTSLVLSYRLWDSCGVETPGICESTLSLNGAISTIYSMQWIWISTWVILAMISILSLGI